MEEEGLMDFFQLALLVVGFILAALFFEAIDYRS